MQTIDDLDLLKYVAGGEEIQPGDGDGDGGGGGDGGTVSLGESASAAVAASGITSTTDGLTPAQVDAAVDTLTAELGADWVTAAKSGEAAGLTGETLQQAQLNNQSAFSANSTLFIGGWVIGHVLHK